MPDAELSNEEILESDNEGIEEWRAANRRRLSQTTSKLFLYGFAYLFVYLSFYIPCVISGGLIKPSVDLSQSRIGIDLILNEDNLSKICAILAVLVYLPLWKLSELVASYVSTVVTKYTFVNEYKYLVFTVLSMIFWSFFIGGNIIWLLNEKVAWFQSMLLSLTVCFFLFIYGFTADK